jgi:hypothetical protein
VCSGTSDFEGALDMFLTIPCGNGCGSVSSHGNRYPGAGKDFRFSRSLIDRWAEERALGITSKNTLKTLTISLKISKRLIQSSLRLDACQIRTLDMPGNPQMKRREASLRRGPHQRHMKVQIPKTTMFLPKFRLPVLAFR